MKTNTKIMTILTGAFIALALPVLAEVVPAYIPVKDGDTAYSVPAGWHGQKLYSYKGHGKYQVYGGRRAFKMYGPPPSTGGGSHNPGHNNNHGNGGYNGGHHGNGGHGGWGNGVGHGNNNHGGMPGYGGHQGGKHWSYGGYGRSWGYGGRN